MKHHIIVAGLAAAFVSPFATAHIVLQQKTADAGSYYRAAFQVGHGCNGSATTTVEVEIPPGVGSVKPMPKAGWKLDIEEGELAVPVTAHGKTQTRGVTRVRWSGGPLEDRYYDEFVMQLKLPDTPGPVYFKTTQRCEQGVAAWVQLPGAGEEKLDFPAPVLKTTADPHAGHAGH